MNEILISYAPDGTPMAEALAASLNGAITVARHWNAAGLGDETEDFQERLERSAHAVFVVTPGWRATCWPSIERYISSALCDPAGFLAKLVLVDLSHGTSVPALLRPLLKASFNIQASQTRDLSPMVKAVAASISKVRESKDISDCAQVAGNDSRVREIFVAGHPGSGKSAFCGLLKARLGRLGVPVIKVDAYSYLQVLFRIDQLKQDATRFAPDELCEFIIKDPYVLDESVSLVQQRLLGKGDIAGGVTIIELAFSESNALVDVIGSLPNALIVHIDAPLQACKDRNAARGAILAQHMRGAASSSEAFDTDSDVHYVPPGYYDTYARDPSKWEAGPYLLMKRFADRYYRIDNAQDHFQNYKTICESVIETVIVPRFADAPIPLAVGLGKDRGDSESL